MPGQWLGGRSTVNDSVPPTPPLAHYLLLFDLSLLVDAGQNLGHVGLKSEPAHAKLTQDAVHLNAGNNRQKRQRRQLTKTTTMTTTTEPCRPAPHWGCRRAARARGLSSFLSVHARHLPPASPTWTAPRRALVSPSCSSLAPYHPCRARKG